MLEIQVLDLEINIAYTCLLFYVVGLIRGVACQGEPEGNYPFFAIFWPLAALFGFVQFLLKGGVDNKFIFIVYPPTLVSLAYFFTCYTYTEETRFLPLSAALISHKTPVEFTNVSKIDIGSEGQTARIYYRDTEGYYSAQEIRLSAPPKSIQVYENAESPGIYSYDKRTRTLSLYLGKNTEMRGFTYK